MLSISLLLIFRLPTSHLRSLPLAFRRGLDQLLHNLIIIPVLAILPLFLVISFIIALEEPQTHVVRVDLPWGGAEDLVAVGSGPFVKHEGHEVGEDALDVLLVGFGLDWLVQVVLDSVADYQQVEVDLLQLLVRERVLLGLQVLCMVHGVLAP